MTRRLLLPLGLLLAALVLAVIEYRSARDTSQTIFDHTIDPEDYQDTFTSTSLSNPEAAASRRVRVTAPLENAWMTIEVTVVRDDGTEFDSAELYIDYFLRPQRGIHWTWGTPIDSAELSVPKGTYQLRVHATPKPSTATFPPLRVELLPVVSGSAIRLFACAVTAVLGTSFLLRGLAKRRVIPPPTYVPPAVAAGAAEANDPFSVGRLRFIDGLRGIAAVGVLVCHLFVPEFLPGARLIEQTMPAPVMETLRGGFLGVEVFFVLSGFVIAYSIRRYRVTPGFILRFIARRFLRLDPPYYIGIILAVLIMADAMADSLHAALQYFQNVRGFAINALYLQDLLGYRSPIGTVAWTLCLEVQFYLALVTLTGFSEWIGGCFSKRDTDRLIGRVTWWLLLGSLAVVSVVYWYPASDHFNFFGTWHRFFLGVLTFRCLASRTSPLPLAALLVLLAIVSALFSDPRGLTAVATSGAILLAGKTHGLGSWLSGGVWQFLGRISYSLYLYHIVLAIPFVGFLWSHLPHTLASAWLLVPVGLAIAIACAWVMHVLIERPSMALSQRVRYTRSK